MKMKLNIKKYIVNHDDDVNKNDKELQNDYLVKSIGAFGRWQLTSCIIISISRLMAMWNLLSVLYLTAKTDFACVKFKDNVTIDAVNSTCYDDCIQYEYHHEVFEETLISEFDLICDRAWLASFTQTALMCGLTIGVSIFGWISDRFGRYRALILSAVMDIVFMVAAPFSPDYWTFTCLRFFAGFASGGVMTITIVFILEIIGPQYREVAANAAISVDGMALTTITAFAYFSPTWSMYLLSYGIFCGGILIALLFLSETPRWLIANGKMFKAVENMTKVAKINNLTTVGIKENVTESIIQLNVNEQDAPNFTYIDLFRTRELAVKTVSSTVIWFVTGLCYYGINQYISFLGSNTYITVLILGLAQISTSPIALIATKLFGRKTPIIASFFIAGTTMVLLVFLPVNTWPSSILGVIGSSAISVVFSIIYLYATELYPTAIRNMGFSFSASGSKFGAMLAPFVANIRPYWVASLIFAVLPFIAAGFCFLLPETKGKKLQDTLDE